MFFRRELDFDELIETIDQLADSEIDEVVDWQMTESPAAKTQGIKPDASTSDPSPLARITRTIQGMNEALSVAYGRREPTRTEVQLGRRNAIVIPTLNPSELLVNPVTDESRFTTVVARRIEYEVQTMWDPTRKILHIRLAWSRDGIAWQYQQVGVSAVMIEGARSGIEILRSEDILSGRRIVVHLDPEARNREYPIRAFLESDQ